MTNPSKSPALTTKAKLYRRLATLEAAHASVLTLATFVVNSAATLDSAADRLAFATRASIAMDAAATRAASRPALARKAATERHLQAMQASGASPFAIAAAAMEAMDVNDRATTPEIETTL